VSAHLACAARERPRFEIGDIVRQHRDELEHVRPLNIDQQRALSAIALCRTPALGGHLDACASCGHEHPAYNSCRNRHCPKCQAIAQQKWVDERLARVLPVPHFHVVFTLPAELRALAAYRKRVVYDLLFETASATLLDVGRGEKLGGLLGITAVLHTWTRELALHPHLHCIVTGGALASSGERWRRARDKYLLPVRVLSDVFRGKFMAALRREHARNSFDGFDAFADPEGFEQLCSAMAKQRWVVYAKKPFAGTEQVYRYLGRYTHRVGIANSRLLDVDDEHVHFRTKDGESISLSPIDFLTRFVQHVLPKRFVKIRHFGLYAAMHVNGKLEIARALLQPTCVSDDKPAATGYLEILLALTGRDARRCVRCGEPVVMIALPNAHIPPTARAPPS
jgi:hypothetical protein